MVESRESAWIQNLVLQPKIVGIVLEQQQSDVEAQEVIAQLSSGAELKDWKVRTDGGLTFKGRLFVLESEGCREEVLRHFHHSKFTVHPGSTKMYRDLRRQFWWKGMKREVADFVSKCLTYQQVKAEYQRPAGKMEPLPIAKWKWEHITMDFVTGFPKLARKNDSIWVIVDRLIKSVHFLPIRNKRHFDHFK